MICHPRATISAGILEAICQCGKVLWAQSPSPEHIFYKVTTLSQLWGHKHVIPALRKGRRQEDHVWDKPGLRRREKKEEEVVVLVVVVIDWPPLLSCTTGYSKQFCDIERILPLATGLEQSVRCSNYALSSFLLSPSPITSAGVTHSWCTTCCRDMTCIISLAVS